MSTFKASDIIDKTLIAKRAVNLYRLPEDGAPIVYTVAPGQTVGKVFTYLTPGLNRNNLYWGFYDANGKPYYAEHQTGYFDIKALSEQGALTLAEQQSAAVEASMTTGDKIFRLIKNALLIGAGVYLLNTIIKKQ